VSDLGGRTVLVVGCRRRHRQRDSSRRAARPARACSTPSCRGSRSQRAGDEPVCRVDLRRRRRRLRDARRLRRRARPAGRARQPPPAWTQRTCFPDVPTADFRRILDIDLVRARAGRAGARAAPAVAGRCGRQRHVPRMSEAVLASRGMTSGAYAAAKAGLRWRRCATPSSSERRAHPREHGWRGLHRDADDGAARSRRPASGYASRPPSAVSGRPGDLGPPVVFLLSDGAGYITGQTRRSAAGCASVRSTRPDG
jgi:NAD(P)-dependent dehydrogenase (short-subunit alcohol dehydrogenase family)